MEEKADITETANVETESNALTVQKTESADIKRETDALTEQKDRLKILSFLLAVLTFVPKAMLRGLSALNRKVRLRMSLKLTIALAIVFCITFSIATIIIYGVMLNDVYNSGKKELEHYYSLISADGANISALKTETPDDLARELELKNISLLILTKPLEKIWSNTKSQEAETELIENASWIAFKQLDGKVYMSRALAFGSAEIRIYLAKDLTDEFDVIPKVMRTFLYVFVFAFVLLIVLGGMTNTVVVAPIKKMTSDAKNIASESISLRLDTSSEQDELRELAEVFNLLLDNIQNTVEAQERFVGDASHEMRTPISVIKGYSSMLKRWGHEDKDILAESAEAIEKEADNMSALLENLLLLSKSNRDVRHPDYESFSLDELVDETVKEELMVDKAHIIEITRIQPVNITASRPMLKQLIRIILNNAVKYTHAGGFIGIACYQENGYKYVVVDDKGIGIAPKDLPRVFDRFFRADKVRSREGGGHGLGMAIAKKIADAHNGEIIIESVLGHGTKVTIKLPPDIKLEN